MIALPPAPPAIVISTVSPSIVLNQKTTGWCSPIVNNTGNGTVTITCIGVNPVAMLRLNHRLHDQKLATQEAVNQADNFATLYHNLLDAVNAPGTSTDPLTQLVRNDIEQGDLDHAAKLLTAVKATDQQNVDKAAEHDYQLALIEELQFQFDDALRDSAMAYQLRPDVPAYGAEYGGELLHAHDLKRAAEIVPDVIRNARSVAAADPSIRAILARLLSTLGNVYSQSDRQEDALAQYKESLDLRRAIALENPSFAIDIAKTLNNLGDLYDSIDKPVLAESAFLEAINIRQKYAMSDPDHYLQDLAETWKDLADLYDNRDFDLKARDAYKTSIAMWRTVVDKQPAYRDDLARTLTDAAGNLLNVDQTADAEASIAEAETIRRSEVQANGSKYEGALSHTLSEKATMLDQQHRYADAEKAALEALRLRQKIADSQPGDSVATEDLAVSWGDLGSIYIDSGRLSDQITAVGKSVDLFAELYKRAPDRFRSEYVSELDDLGLALSNSGRYKDEEDVYTKAMSMLMQIDSASSQDLLASVTLDLGTLYDNQNRYPEADASYQKAFSIWQAIRVNSPDEYDTDLAKTAFDMAILYRHMNRPSDAEAKYELCLSLQKRVAADDDLLLPDLFDYEESFGTFYKSTNRAALAETQYKSALKVVTTLVSGNPSQYLSREADINGYLMLLYLDTKRWKESEQYGLTEVARRRKLYDEDPKTLGSFKQSLVNMSVLYGKMNRNAEAAKYKQQAESLSKVDQPIT